MKVTGFLAYMRGFIRVLYLIGGGNRLATLCTWLRALVFTQNPGHRATTFEQVHEQAQDHHPHVPASDAHPAPAPASSVTMAPRAPRLRRPPSGPKGRGGAARWDDRKARPVVRALPCAMRTGRIGPDAGVVGSLILMGLGVWMAVVRPDSDLATFGWLLLLVEAVGVVANVVVGTRMR